jgi:hypothetical protein
MTADPTTPISSRLLGTGQGLIVTFPIQKAATIELRGKDVSSVRAFFFKVVKSQEYFFEYQQLGTITAGAGNALDYDYLGEDGHGAGDDILRLVNDDFKVYHLGFAPRDPNLRVYEAVAAQGPNRATDHENQGEPDPTAGDNFGFYTSRQIPNQFDPPALTERLAIRNAESGAFLQFGFMADGVDIIDGNSDILITGRTYQLQPITDPDEQDFLLRQAVLDRADQTLRSITVQVGGLFTYEIGNAMPGNWVDVDGLARDLVLDGLVPPGEEASSPVAQGSAGGVRELEPAGGRAPDSGRERDQPNRWNRER